MYDKLMTKRLAKKEVEGIIRLIIISLPILILICIANAIGGSTFIILLLVIIVYSIWYNDKKKKERILCLEKRKKERIAYLTNKYHDQEIVNRIMDEKFWQGQTSEQLIDSIGTPLDIDEKILKTKKTEIWKYHSDGRNRFRIRITLEQDIVVGWDKR